MVIDLVKIVEMTGTCADIIKLNFFSDAELRFQNKERAEILRDSNYLLYIHFEFRVCMETLSVFNI